MHVIDYMVVEKRSDIMKYAERYAFNNVDRQENPSGSYHGNMTIHDIVCDSYEEAQLRIKGWDKGWYSDHAVQFKDKKALKPTKQMETLKNTISETRKKRDEFIKAHMPNNVKAELIGCKKCNSKIAKKYLRGTYCPVCRADLRPKSTMDRIRGYDAKISELESKYAQLEKNQKGKCLVKWLVKVEVHC